MQYDSYQLLRTAIIFHNPTLRVRQVFVALGTWWHSVFDVNSTRAAVGISSSRFVAPSAAHCKKISLVLIRRLHDVKFGFAADAVAPPWSNLSLIKR